jgi:hypothetical protein
MEYEHSQSMAVEFEKTQMTLRQPHVYMKPKVCKDGDMWCALLGENLMEGVSAFGKTPQQAAEAWDLVWLNGDSPQPKQKEGE